MRRTVALILRAASVLLAVLLGFLLGTSGQSATAAVAVDAPPASLAYTFDGDHTSVALTCAIAERGPPTHTYTGSTDSDAVERWSRGASARPDGTTPRLATCYTTLSRFAQGDLATGMTVGHAQVAGGELSALRRTEVAANAGPRMLPIGPWGQRVVDARTKLPGSWGPGVPNKKGVGTRWFDPSNPGNGVRVDQGLPGSTQLSQQVDHVVVRSGGKVIGPDGKPIVGSLSDNPQAHIPLADWMSWSSWSAP